MYKRLNVFLSVIFAGLFLSVCAVQYMYYGGKIEPVGNFSDEGMIYLYESSLYSPKGRLSVKMSDENIIILKNGEICEGEKTGDIYSFEVNNGDIFHADLRNAGGEGVIFLYEVSENITFPKASSKMLLRGGVEKLFCVQTSE